MIERITATTRVERAVLGGKGAGLARLLALGLSVPEAWCVPAATTSGDRAAALEGELRAFFAEFTREFPGARLAVRSSAVAEDLEAASFAGVYESVLDVGSADELVEAVARCLAAVATERARRYRAHASGGETPMALVLQRMLAPDVAGVLLTANPRRPFAPELVVEAAWGQGETVVAGRGEPDRFVVSREAGKTLEARIGAKATGILFEPGRGRVEREAAEERRSIASLSDEQLAALHAVATTIERAVGPRQDLEWAFEGERLYLLQLRPIVGLPSERPAVVHSRKFGDEYLADFTMPLTHTLLTRWIVEDYMRDVARLAGNHAAAEVEPIVRHRGYVYVNGEYLVRMARGIPRPWRRLEGLDWFPPFYADRLRDEPFEPRLLVGAALATLRDPRGRVAANPRFLARHVARLERTLPPLLEQDYDALSVAAARRQLDDAYELGREHFRIIRWGMGFYSPAFHGLLRARLEAWAGDASGELYRDTIGGLSGTKTAEIGRDVWALARAAERDESVAERIRGGASVEALRASGTATAFLDELARFVRAHGHRSGAREIAAPRWRETPDVVLGFVRAQLAAGAPDPAAAERVAVERRRAAVREALARVRRGLLGAARAEALSYLLAQAEVYTRYRENQRYYLDYLLFHIRLLVLSMGRRLVARGVLGARDDVFLLEADELRVLVAGERATPELDARLDERRREYARFRHRLPAAYLYDGIEVELEAEGANPSGGALSGLGASAGVVRGALRVVAELGGLCDVRPGEILVTSNTDPGWTTVFPLLGGLVTETGGMLSHGALLAREYGIPAVTGLANATRLLRTGDVVELDGTRGTLRFVTSHVGDDAASGARDGLSARRP